MSLAFVQGIHRWPVNFPHKWPVTRKMFPFDDVIMLFVPQSGVCDSHLIHATGTTFELLGTDENPVLPRSLDPAKAGRNRIGFVSRPSRACFVTGPDVAEKTEKIDEWSILICTSCSMYLWYWSTIMFSAVILNTCHRVKEIWIK